VISSEWLSLKAMLYLVLSLTYEQIDPRNEIFFTIIFVALLILIVIYDLS
jgi:hypothetical protein